MIPKLVTALAGSFLLAYIAYRVEAQGLMARLGNEVAGVMLAHGVVDGSVRWVDSAGNTVRRATLSGTADGQTRQRIVAKVSELPGVAGADWR